MTSSDEHEVVILVKASRKYSTGIHFPADIKSKSSLSSVKIDEYSRRHDPGHLAGVYSIANQLVDNFDGEAAKALSQTLDKIDEIDINSVNRQLETIIGTYDDLNKRIIEVEKPFWGDIQATSYYAYSLVYKTTVIAKTVLLHMPRQLDKNTKETIKKKLLELRERSSDDKELNDVKLGFFAGLEPIFIIGILYSANYLNDSVFLIKYERLLDRFYSYVLREHMEEYLEATKFSQRKPDHKAYDSFVETFSTERI